MEEREAPAGEYGAAIDAWLMEHDAEMIQFARDLLQIPSMTAAPEAGHPLGRDVGLALERFLAEAQRLALPTVNVDGYAGHAEVGAGEEIVGVLCHLDVVPVGDGWAHPPFAAEIVDDRLVGRGAIDDKGPAAAALYALAAVRSLNLPLRRRIRLIAGTDEESGWRCLTHYVEKMERPNLGFSPDANFPIINAEKGILDVTLVHDWPEGGPIRSLAGGSRPNVVPDEATAILTGERGGRPVRVKGRAAHGSTPEKGDNAVLRLLQQLLASNGSQAAEVMAGERRTKSADAAPGEAELGGADPTGPEIDWSDEAASAQRRILTTMQIMGESLDGAGLGIRLADAPSGPLTSNLGLVRTSVGCVEGSWNIRYPVTFQGEEILARIRAHVDADGWRVAAYHDNPPHHAPREHPVVRALAAVYEDVVGEEAVCLAIGGGTYARLIPNGVAFGPLFPGEEELAHEANESIALDTLRRGARIWARAMTALAQI